MYSMSLHDPDVSATTDVEAITCRDFLFSIFLRQQSIDFLKITFRNLQLNNKGKSLNYFILYSKIVKTNFVSAISSRFRPPFALRNRFLRLICFCGLYFSLKLSSDKHTSITSGLLRPY